MNNQVIKQHVKDFLDNSFTVFIKSPVYAECILSFSSEYPYAVKDNGQWELTILGLMTAEGAVLDLESSAKFIISNREKLTSFFNDYEEKLYSLSHSIDIVKEQKDVSRGWRDHSTLIVQEYKLKREKDTLFDEMYLKCFPEADSLGSRKAWKIYQYYCDNGNLDDTSKIVSAL